MKSWTSWTLLAALVLARPAPATTLAPFGAAPSFAAARAGTPLEQATHAFEAGEYARVLELAAALPDADADWPKMQYLAGETGLLLGRTEDAERAFRNVLSKREHAIPAQVGLARALTALGKTDEAAKLLDAALAAEPKDVGGRTARGELYARLGKLDEARTELEAANKLDPKAPMPVRALVEVLLRQDANPEAAAAIEAFARARPEHPFGPFLLAIVMERDGNDADAIAQYQEALKLDPNFLDAHKNLAILCHTLSNTYRDRERTLMAYEHYERYFALGGADEGLKKTYEDLLRFKGQILGS